MNIAINDILLKIDCLDISVEESMVYLQPLLRNGP